jgi:hypothetical protein
MASDHQNRVFELLARREDPARLLIFVRRISEGYSAAFADSARSVAGASDDRTVIHARGNLRRHLMDGAFRKAATDAGYPISIGRTEPPTWSFPIVRIGAFSLTVGIVDRPRTRAPRRLRCHGQYMIAHAERNSPLNPQRSFFDGVSDGVERVVPRGAFGALLVAEPCVHLPDSPLFLGFWISAPNLRQTYFRCDLEHLLQFLHTKVTTSRPRKRPVIRRKRPMLRTSRKDPPNGK